MNHPMPQTRQTGLQLALLCVLALPLFGAQAAEVGLCLPEVLPEQMLASATYSRLIYVTDGQQRHLVVSPQSLPDSACEKITLSSNSEVDWAGLVPERLRAEPQQRAVILQGSFPSPIADNPVSSFSVSEVIPLSRPQRTVAARPRVNYAVNMLDALNTRQFGVEERAQWQAPSRLTCQPGTRPAGVVLQANSNWPDDSPQHLRVQASGSGLFTIAIADSDRLRSESVVPIGRTALRDNSELFNYQLPASGQPWRAISIVCPNVAATITLESVELVPGNLVSEAEQTNRSAWFWSPQRWREQQDRLLNIAVEEALDTLYITIPVSADGEVDRSAVAEFVAAASEQDIAIWPVIGDRNDVLPSSRPALLNRLRAYVNYNESVSEEARLQGIQLDVEPYLLPGFTADPEYWRNQYLVMLQDARAAIGSDLALDLVVPVWWGSSPQWGTEFLNQLTPLNVSLTVMNYRTEHERLRDESVPFLVWAQLQQTPVRMALETGSLGSEIRRAFERRTRHGELWQFQIDSQFVLILFSQVQTGLSGQAFEAVDDSLYSATNLTFNGQQEAMNRAADYLQQQFSDWQYFSGIALHGLEEVYWPHTDE